VCGRSFAEDRIAKHMVACEKSRTKVRKVFNPAKQRLQGLDNVNVKAGEREALMAAERRRELMQAAGAGYGLASRSPQPPAGDLRHVLTGKDGRPLSPLSAAVARAKAGEDPFDEDPNLLPSTIVPCPCCGRNFAPDRLHIHLAICQKVAVNSQSRKVWDSSRQRVQGGTEFGGSPQPARGPTRKASFPRSAMRTGSAAPRASDWEAGGGGNGGGLWGGGGGGGSSAPPARRAAGGGTDTSMPAKKLPKWKRDHAAFQAALKAGRQVKAAQEAGLPLPPPPPSSHEHDDRTACPHCGRRFNQQAAERHIPKCNSISAKPKMLTRGGGGGIHNAMPGAVGPRGSVRF
jgi:hypothetical protein